MATLKEIFKDIADAIRNKDGSTDPITPSEMPDKIAAITTGQDTSDATATAADILQNATAYVKGEKITGTIPEIKSGYREKKTGTLGSYVSATSDNGTMYCQVRYPFNNPKICRAGSSVQVWFPMSNFGNATVTDVVEGKTFTSEEGLVKSGTLAEADSSIALVSSSIGENPSTNMPVLTGTIDSDMVMRNGTTVSINANPENADIFGDAIADQVLTGSTFTSKDGMAIDGSMKKVTSISNSIDSVSFVQGGVLLTGSQSNTGYIDSSTKVNSRIAGVTFGDASASDVKAGKTFTSQNGLKVTGTLSSTATLDLTSSSPVKNNTSLLLSGKPTGTELLDSSSTVNISTPLTNLGDATASEVANGKTFTSSAGVKVTGSLATPSSLSLNASSVATSGSTLYLANNSRSSDYRLLSNNPYFIYTGLSNFGDATAADVVSGKTFTSSVGLRVTGTGSSGGIDLSQYSTITVTSISGVDFESFLLDGVYLPAVNFSGKLTIDDSFLKAFSLVVSWLDGSDDSKYLSSMFYYNPSGIIGKEIMFASTSYWSDRYNRISVGDNFTTFGVPQTAEQLFKSSNFKGYSNNIASGLIIPHDVGLQSTTTIDGLIQDIQAIFWHS